MTTIGNVLWFILGGWIAGTVWLLAGALCCVTVIGIPFGMACFRIASFAYAPFGKELVDAREVGEGRIAMTGLANFLWVVAIGLWTWILFVLAGISMFIGIVTIPFGIAYFKLASASFAPLGKRIVSTDMARVIRERKARGELDRRTGRTGGGAVTGKWDEDDDGDDGDWGEDGRTECAGAAPSPSSADGGGDGDGDGAAGEAGEEGEEGKDEAEPEPEPIPEPEPEPEEEEEEEEEIGTGGDVYLRKVRLGRQLEAAEGESLSAAERSRLERIRDLHRAGMEAQQAGQLEAAEALYAKAATALAAWRKDRRARRAASPSPSPRPQPRPRPRSRPSHGRRPPTPAPPQAAIPPWAPAAIAALIALVVSFSLWRQANVRRPARSVAPHAVHTDYTPPPPPVPAQVPARTVRGAWDGAYTGDARTVALPNGVRMQLKWCPPGTFTMGSPATEEGRYGDETQHAVTLTRGFWMAETEVTQAQWKSVMGNNPSCFKGDNLPVENVSWNDCQAFVDALNAHHGQEGMRWALPTEAQWEYACRAGSTGPFAGLGWLDEMGWYSGNSGRQTHPVGQKKANAWGLYDMHGNVLEWCADWYGGYPSGAVMDPTGPASGSYRVIRGGGWGSSTRGCRSADRGRFGPGICRINLGLRVALLPVQ